MGGQTATRAGDGGQGRQSAERVTSRATLTPVESGTGPHCPGPAAGAAPWSTSAPAGGRGLVPVRDRSRSMSGPVLLLRGVVVDVTGRGPLLHELARHGTPGPRLVLVHGPLVHDPGPAWHTRSGPAGARAGGRGLALVYRSFVLDVGSVPLLRGLRASARAGGRGPWRWCAVLVGWPNVAVVDGAGRGARCCTSGPGLVRDRSCVIPPAGGRPAAARDGPGLGTAMSAGCCWRDRSCSTSAPLLHRAGCCCTS